MQNIQILGHIKSVCTGTTVDLMASVIHRKANESVMMLPMLLNRKAKRAVEAAVCAKLGQRSCALRAVFMESSLYLC